MLLPRTQPVAMAAFYASQFHQFVASHPMQQQQQQQQHEYDVAIQHLYTSFWLNPTEESVVRELTSRLYHRQDSETMFQVLDILFVSRKEECAKAVQSFDAQTRFNLISVYSLAKMPFRYCDEVQKLLSEFTDFTSRSMLFSQLFWVMAKCGMYKFMDVSDFPKYMDPVALRTFRKQVNHYLYLNPAERYQDVLQFVELQTVEIPREQQFHPRPCPCPSQQQQQQRRRMRIGYITSDLFAHAVCNFLYPVLKHHSFDNVEEVHVFSLAANHLESFSRTEMSRWKSLLQYTLAVHPCHQLTDDAKLAEFIASQRLDMLIDLNGHTEGNRCQMLRYRPAPVMISYMGYPHSTALPEMDYWIVDPVTNPPFPHEHIVCDVTSEELVYLQTDQEFAAAASAASAPPPSSHSFLLFEPIQFMSFSPLSTRVLKQRNRLRVGIFNREVKWSKESLQLYQYLFQFFSRRGIDLEYHVNMTCCTGKDKTELELCTAKVALEMLVVPPEYIRFTFDTSNEEYSGLFESVDLVLDAFPYSGTTTTCNAFYCGVPVLTYSEPHRHCHLERVTESLWFHACPQLAPRFVARNLEEYAELAAQCAMMDQFEWMSTIRVPLKRGFDLMMEPQPFMQRYEQTLLRLMYTR